MDRLAARARHRRAHAASTRAALVLKLRDAGAMRAVGVAGDGVGRRGASRSRDAAVDGRPRARRATSRRASRTSYSRRRPRARRGRRLRLQALDPAPARRRRRGGHRLPARRRRRTSSRRFDGVLLSNGPGDPEPLVDEVAVDARAARPRAGARHLPRPPAARARRRARDVQAPVRPPRREPSGARARDGPRARRRARTTASRSTPSEAREATHVSLYDGTVEGLRLPVERARSVQFHPEAGPGPARRAGRSSSSGSRR